MNVHLCLFDGSFTVDAKTCIMLKHCMILSCLMGSDHCALVYVRLWPSGLCLARFSELLINFFFTHSEGERVYQRNEG